MFCFNSGYARNVSIEYQRMLKLILVATLRQYCMDLFARSVEIILNREYLECPVWL